MSATTSSSGAPIVNGILLTLAPGRFHSLEEFLNYQHISNNVDNVVILLKHSAGPSCTEQLPHIPRADCPPPDLAMPRGAVLPLIDNTIELCQTWRIQSHPNTSQEAKRCINDVQSALHDLRDFAGDDLAALELSLLRSLEHNNSRGIEVPGPNNQPSSPSAEGIGSPKAATPPSPPGTPSKQVRKVTKTTTPEINVSIPDTMFRLSKLRGMNKSELKALLEQDLHNQGITARIQDCSFRGTWTFVYIRFFDVQETHTVRERWTPVNLGKNAFVKTVNAGIPPFLSPKIESRLVEKAPAKICQVTIFIPDPKFAESRLAAIENHELKLRIQGDLKNQGKDKTLDRCKKSPSCKNVRVWTEKMEDVQVLLKWEPSPELFGKGISIRW
ncbi:MAG: hypothetical protein Q9178_005750 [Gyalolechia marmorata]